MTEQEKLVRASTLATGTIMALKTAGYLVGAFLVAVWLVACWFASSLIISLLVKTAHMVGWL